MARKFAKACLGAGLNLVTVLFGLFVFHSALGSQLWLSRTGPWIRQTATPTDFMQLFLDDAPWTNAAANVKVFKVAAPFAIAATDEQLMRMFVSLKKHNIAFALETQMLPVGPNGCGQGVEGYMDPIGLRKLMERIQRLGAELRYLVMDEPLWFGHQSNGKNTCQSTIDEIVKNVATHVAIVKKVFPNVEIDDVEPIASPGEPNDWVAELSSFHRAYKQAVGEPLGAFDADLTWSGNWQPQLTQLAKILHAAGMQFGIIFDGDGADLAPVAWTTHAEERFTQVEADPALVPDRAIIQSWAPQPAHMLPETVPGTMTYLVNRYLSREVVLTLRRDGDRLSGRLTDIAGKPVHGGKVDFIAVAGNSPKEKSPRNVSGEVPATAAKALVALRINTECGCSGPASIDLGAVTYRDSGSNVTLQAPLLPNRGDNLITANLGQIVSRNSAPFPVTPGSHFSFDVLMGATEASANSGYVALVLLNASGAEVLRLRVPFQSASLNLGSSVSDSGGNISMDLPVNLSSSITGFRARYSGGDGYRGATAELP